MTHTQIIHVLFEDEEGNLLANLTGLFQAERVDYTVYATLNYSLTADPSIANITFKAGMNLIIVEGSPPPITPVPIPPPPLKTYTLQDGETVAIEMGGWGSDDFEPDWEWVQFEAGVLIWFEEVGFADGYVSRDFEMGEKGQIDYPLDWVNYHGYLFPFLHNNPIETETIKLKVEIRPSILDVTIGDLLEHPEAYVGKLVEIKGEIIDEMSDHDADHFVYTFSDGTGIVQFLWFPERLSGPYTISGEVTFTSGPRPPIDPFADYMKGIAKLASRSEGYYDLRIQNLTRLS